MTRQIVVAVDGSAPASAAVEWATADARRKGLGLRIVHVCEQGQHGAEQCADILEVAADRARALGGGIEVTTELLAGGVAETLLAESVKADSLVIGSRGLGGFKGLVLGSVGMAVAGHADGPVVVVRGPAAETHERVVVGYDGSPHADAAMEYAIDQARRRDAALHVVYGWTMPAFSPYAVAYDSLIEGVMQEEERAARDRLTPWRERHPDVWITEAHACEHPVAALIEASKRADLVVVGSRGRGGLASAVLGSVSHGVLHHVTCPVAVVRPRPEVTS
ncbi:universal stress protein [Nonomuraea sp. NPDC048826]|uniref:universal stress protein n=1 Tax=Nonomuraea sp. NPDC048826 TaxID=3364347 RepID=UPI003722D201